MRIVNPQGSDLIGFAGRQRVEKRLIHGVAYFERRVLIAGHIERNQTGPNVTLIQLPNPQPDHVFAGRTTSAIIDNASHKSLPVPNQRNASADERDDLVHGEPG